MTKTKIAICIPMTSKKQNWTKLGDSFFITIFLPSFLRTYERHLYDYTFYIGIDKEDDFFNHYLEDFKRRLRPTDNIIVSDKFSGNPCGYWNKLFRMAYNDGNDYICQFGDDIEILSEDWTSYFISVLQEHNNFGVCGGCDINFWVERLMLGKIGILENIFFHRSHYDYFDVVFHKKLKTWWSDDYISGLYYNYTFCCPNIRYSNRNRVATNNTKSRYVVNKKDSELWSGYVLESQKAVKNKKELPETYKNFINKLN